MKEGSGRGTPPPPPNEMSVWGGEEAGLTFPNVKNDAGASSPCFFWGGGVESVAGRRASPLHTTASGETSVSGAIGWVGATFVPHVGLSCMEGDSAFVPHMDTEEVVDCSNPVWFANHVEVVQVREQSFSLPNLPRLHSMPMLAQTTE